VSQTINDAKDQRSIKGGAVYRVQGSDRNIRFKKMFQPEKKSVEDSCKFRKAEKGVIYTGKERGAKRGTRIPFQIGTYEKGQPLEAKRQSLAKTGKDEGGERAFEGIGSYRGRDVNWQDRGPSEINLGSVYGLREIWAAGELRRWRPKGQECPLRRKSGWEKLRGTAVRKNCGRGNRSCT